MRAAEHAPRGPFHLLELRHGLAEIVERGAGVHLPARPPESARHDAVVPLLAQTAPGPPSPPRTPRLDPQIVLLGLLAQNLRLDAASAPAVLDKANADPDALEALRAGARQVDDEHVCASCLADYFRRVFDAIRERVSYHLVLDDPSSVLRLAESEGACDAFYEAVVVRRVEAEGVYHDVVRRGCNLCAALRAEVRGEVCRVEGVN